MYLVISSMYIGSISMMDFQIERSRNLGSTDKWPVNFIKNIKYETVWNQKLKNRTYRKLPEYWVVGLVWEHGLHGIDVVAMERDATTQITRHRVHGRLQLSKCCGQGRN